VGVLKFGCCMRDNRPKKRLVSREKDVLAFPKHNLADYVDVALPAKAALSTISQNM
jgi:hypothetical protein